MLATFQLPTAATWADPWPMYRALREHDPVHHVVPADNPAENSPDYYVLSRHADVWSAACDPETFSSALAAGFEFGELKLLGLAEDVAPAMQGTPGYAEFRKLISAGFTPPQVETLEPTVREFVVQRIERLRADGGGDIVAELFKPLPSMVVAHYLGVPELDRPLFDDWTESVITATNAAGDMASTVHAAFRAMTSIMAYFSELIRLRRLVPGEDTISRLVTAGVGADGDAAGMVSMLAFAFTMIASGIDTTTGMLGGSVQLLHQRPDQRKLLVDRPELIPGSIDEFLRLTSPVQAMGRTATRDVTIAGKMIPQGHRVLLLYGSANRDERLYGADAGELDVQRQCRDLLTFSHGVNRCLGWAVARLQSRIVLSELLARCPDFEVDESGIVWAGSSHVRRPVSVPFIVR